MYTDVFFDWDNTIWDFSANSKLSLKIVFEEFDFGRFFSSFDQFYSLYHTINDSLWAKYRLGQIDKQTLIKSRFNQCFLQVGVANFDLSMKVNARYLFLTTCQTQLVEGAKDVLVKLKNKGIRLYVVTNGFVEVQNRKIENSGLKNLFARCIISDEVGALKPSKEFFDYTFRTTGAAKDTSILIGDDPEADIAGALSYGLKCVFFNPKSIATNYKADYEITNFRQLENILLA